ncbi:unnamed protein product [Moneuplotes crassus]|uniref:Uncharacterized protein n=1 Tax=Euplotes crassus TaxID=5936 RepID=A0AAD1U687_EUPCR|nr:unnamed protein product [Moneuplotes crassus]
MILSKNSDSRINIKKQRSDTLNSLLGLNNEILGNFHKISFADEKCKKGLKKVRNNFYLKSRKHKSIYKKPKFKMFDEDLGGQKKIFLRKGKIIQKDFSSRLPTQQEVDLKSMQNQTAFKSRIDSFDQNKVLRSNLDAFIDTKNEYKHSHNIKLKKLPLHNESSEDSKSPFISNFLNSSLSKDVTFNDEHSLESQYPSDQSIEIDDCYSPDTSIDKKRLKSKILSSNELEKKIETVTVQKLYSILSSRDPRFKKSCSKRYKELEIFKNKANHKEIDDLINKKISYDIFKANILKRSDNPSDNKASELIFLMNEINKDIDEDFTYYSNEIKKRSNSSSYKDLFKDNKIWDCEKRCVKSILNIYKKPIITKKKAKSEEKTKSRKIATPKIKIILNPKVSNKPKIYELVNMKGDKERSLGNKQFLKRQRILRKKKEKIVKRNYKTDESKLNLTDLEFEKWTREIENRKLRENQSQKAHRSVRDISRNDINSAYIPLYVPVFKKKISKNVRTYNITERLNESDSDYSSSFCQKLDLFKNNF